MSARIVHARSPDLLEHVRALFREYASTVDAEPCFHGFEQELGALPGPYAHPQGALIVAFNDAHPVGCVAVRPLLDATDHGLASPDDGLRRAELKRLFVRAPARGKGVARALAMAAIDHARDAGYAALRLDTLPTMKEAIRLYQSLGFVEIPTAECACTPQARFFELPLAPALDVADPTGALSHDAMRSLTRQAERVMAQLAARFNASGSVRARIIRDDEMSALHGEHSGDPSTTDVLTFDLREDPSSPALDVDVLLCVDEAERAAQARRHAPEAELLLYLLHACLHCLGHNDDTPEASARMHAEEDAILTAVGLPAIYSAPASS